MSHDRLKPSVPLKRKLASSLIGLLLLFGGAVEVSAAPSHTTTNDLTAPKTLQPMPQPLALKLAVTLGGVALIGAELWWFLLSKPQAK